MKPYPLILIAIRLLAVVLAVYYIYVIGSVVFFGLIGSGLMAPGMEEMVAYTRRQTFIDCVIKISSGVLLYFIAPFLTRLITLGSESER